MAITGVKARFLIQTDSGLFVDLSPHCTAIEADDDTSEVDATPIQPDSTAPTRKFLPSFQTSGVTLTLNWSPSAQALVNSLNGLTGVEYSYHPGGPLHINGICNVTHAGRVPGSVPDQVSQMQVRVRFVTAESVNLLVFSRVVATGDALVHTIPGVQGGLGSLLVVLASWRSNISASITSADYGANALSQEVFIANANEAVAAYSLDAPSGTQDVVITFPNATSAVVAADLFSYTNTVTPFGTPVSTQTAGGTSISAIAAAQTDGLCLDVLAVGSNQAGEAEEPHADSGQAERYVLGAGVLTGSNALRGASSTKPGAVSVSMGWSWGVSRQAAYAILTINPKAGA